MATITSIRILPNGKIHIETDYSTYEVTQEQLKNLLIEDGQMCEDCEDSGEIVTDGTDADGNVERGVNTTPCHCRADKD